jgi:tetrahydrodipicolinate N-succinyltransferase
MGARADNREARASIGSGAVILCGLTIGEGARVGAGAVVVGDVPPRTLVVGVPCAPARTGGGLMAGIPLVNLVRQYERLAPQLDRAIRDTCARADFILGQAGRDVRNRRSLPISASAIASVWRAEPMPCT